MNIYLDSAASSALCDSARSVAMSLMDSFGNPSSSHTMGIAAEKEITIARQHIARAINASPNEIYFTASGTESNNIAIFGAAKLPMGKGIITSPTEHPSVRLPIMELTKRGFELFHVEHFEDGSIDINSLKHHLEAGKPCLISLHHVHNETGVIQDIEAIAALIKGCAPRAIFHVDAVQSFGKIPIDAAKARVDMLSLSAHKLGGLRGCGALYIRQGVHINPLILGGGQERGIRAGTENVVGIGAFGAAANEKCAGIWDNYEHVHLLRHSFLDGISKVGGVTLNGGNASPYILNISVDMIRPEVLLNALSAKGVYISAGAACSATAKKRGGGSSSNNKNTTNAANTANTVNTMKAYGLPESRGLTSVRISFSSDNTMDEIALAASVFVECVEELRKVRGLR